MSGTRFYKRNRHQSACARLECHFARRRNQSERLVHRHGQNVTNAVQGVVQGVRLFAGRAHQGFARKRVEHHLLRQRRRQNSHGVQFGEFQRSFQHQLRRHSKQPAQTLQRNGLRHGQGGNFAVYEAGSLHRLRRKETQTRSPCRNRRRQKHLRPLLYVRRRGGQVPGRARTRRNRGDDCAAHTQRNSRPSAFSHRRGAWISDARACVGDSVGRRKPAYPPCHADRQRAYGRVVHSGRAQYRIASEGQFQTAQFAQRAARPRQHAHSGGTRRGDDTQCRLHRRHRTRRGRREAWRT